MRCVYMKDDQGIEEEAKIEAKRRVNGGDASPTVWRAERPEERPERRSARRWTRDSRSKKGIQWYKSIKNLSFSSCQKIEKE